MSNMSKKSVTAFARRNAAHLPLMRQRQTPRSALLAAFINQELVRLQIGDIRSGLVMRRRLEQVFDADGHQLDPMPTTPPEFDPITTDEISGQIMAIAWEDGSGTSFNLTLSVTETYPSSKTYANEYKVYFKCQQTDLMADAHDPFEISAVLHSVNSSAYEQAAAVASDHEVMLNRLQVILDALEMQPVYHPVCNHDGGLTCQEADTAIFGLSSIVEDLSKRLELMDDKYGDVNHDLYWAKGELSKVRRQLQTCEGDFQAMKQQRDDLLAGMYNKDSTIAALQARLTMHDKMHYEEDINRMHGLIADLRRDKDTLSTELQDMKQHRDDLLRQCHTLKQHRSITLRAIRSYWPHQEIDRDGLLMVAKGILNGESVVNIEKMYQQALDRGASHPATKHGIEQPTQYSTPHPTPPIIRDEAMAERPDASSIPAIRHLPNGVKIYRGGDMTSSSLAVTFEEGEISEVYTLLAQPIVSEGHEMRIRNSFLDYLSDRRRETGVGVKFAIRASQSTHIGDFPM